MSGHPKNPKEGDAWFDPKSETRWVFNEGAWVATQIIDWKMEADRANRLYGDASRRIEQLEERMRGADALIQLWETRATRAEKEVMLLRADKRQENDDVFKGFRGNNEA